MEYKPFRGVIPACLLPFDERYEIDEKTYREHLRYLSSVAGVTAITINGHAGEVTSLTQKERHRSMRIAAEELSGKTPIICGIPFDGTMTAIEEAKIAKAEGADGLLMFPSCEFTAGGGTVHPEMVFRHYEKIAAAVDLPMVMFSYAASSDLHYPLETFVRLCREIDNIVCVKECTYDILFYEALYRELKGLKKDVALLTSFSKGLLASFAVGADGLLSGNGSIIPEYQVALFESVNRNDLFTARKIWDQMWPIVSACYSAPFTDMHNRMKYVAKKLGRFPCEFVRQPLLPLSQAERTRLDAAIVASGLK